PFAVRLRVPAYRFRLAAGGPAPVEETVAFLESRPYETAMIKYGSLDTVRKWMRKRLGDKGGR
ncbi:MAG: hypothetical protein QME89_05330, partial [Actinomycetota bacterium]|nr:hypothetical protein [Actinomycetota bacterium]